MNATTAPRVAVLTPVFKHAQYLPAMLESLRAQTVSDWECAIVIDGPDAEIEHIARAAAAEDSRLSVHVLPHWVGLPGARNACVKATSAPWLLCFDADDLMDETLIEDMLALAEPNLGDGAPWPLVYSPARQLFPDGRTSVYRYPKFDPKNFAEHHQIPGPAMMRREMFDALGGFDESLTMGGEDWEYLARAVVRGWIAPAQLAESRWTYRQHDGPRVSRVGMKRWHILQPMLRAIIAGQA